MSNDNVRTSAYINFEDFEVESSEPNYEAFSELVANAHDSVTRDKYGESEFAAIIGSGIDRYHIPECYVEAMPNEEEPDFIVLAQATSFVYSEYRSNAEYSAEDLVGEVGSILRSCRIELEENGLQKTLKRHLKRQ